MAETIGRVEFIVGLDGRNLSREAKAEGKKLAKMGDDAGAEYGENFADAAGHEIDLKLSKAARRISDGLGDEGHLAGRTFSQNLTAEVTAGFRRMERETVKALSNRDAFIAFASGFDTVDAAIDKLRHNMERLSREQVSIGFEKIDGKSIEIFADFFDDFDDDGALQSIEKWGDELKAVEEQTLRVNAANDKLKLTFDRLRDSLDADSFDGLAEKFGSAEDAAVHLRTQLEELRRGGAVNDREYHRFGNTIERQLAGAVKRAAALARKLTGELGDTAAAAGRAAAALGDGGGGGGGGLGGSLKKFLGARGGLSTGAIIGLVGGLLEPATVAIQGLVAALSSLIGVIGAGLAGAAAVGSAALVGLIWTVWKATEAIGMMGEEFPAAKKGMDALAKASKADSAAFARAWGPSLAEFTNTLAQLWRDDKMGERAGEALGKVTAAFTDVLNSPAYKNFQTAMETSIPNSIAGLGSGLASGFGGFLNIVAAAGPHLERVADLFADFMAEWEKGIQEGADSGALGDTIGQMVDDFLLLLDTVKKVWNATTQFFDEGRESGRKLLKIIGLLFDDWSEWMDSVEGQEALEKFFDSGLELVQSLADQLPKLQRMFDKIVTQDAVDRTTALLDQLGDLAEGPLAEIIQAVGALDVFGTIATVLNDLLIPLKPLLDALTPIFAVVSGILEIFSRIVGVILTALAPAFIPLRFAFEALNTIIEQFLIWSQPLFDALEDIGTVIAEAADEVWLALEPAIQDLYEAFLTLLPQPEELARILRENVIPMIQTVVAWIIDELIPKIQTLTEKIADTIEEHGGWEQIMKDVEDAFKKLKTWVETDGIAMLDKLIEVLGWVEDHWDDVTTAIEGVKTAMGVIKTVFDAFYVWFSGPPAWLSAIISSLETLIGLQSQVDVNLPNGGKNPGGNEDAAGRLVLSPRLGWTGEAGPEAIVPLRRPLSQVDPSVRALSAVAQGKPTGGGGLGGSGINRQINISEGAIQITSPDPWRAATETVNQISERAIA